MKKNNIITLNQFISDQQNQFPFVKGSLSKIFRDIQLAAKMINRDVRKAGLIDVLGNFGETNIQGEEQKKLDVISNDVFLKLMDFGGDCVCVVSEENDDIHWCPNGADAKYILAIDPLDGSSNIDVNASIGSIFSIYKRLSPDKPVSKEDILQKGTAQVAAGYVIYGTATMLVYTTGNGVNGFTLDDSIQEFCLSHPDIKTPETGTIFSLNEGNLNEFPQGVIDYIAWCKESNKEEQRPYSARYIGSLIADFHRNLLKGGIYLYPSTAKAPNGKLRLLYECNPMAFLVEQAGGKATNGSIRIMEIEPTDLHQRSPIIIGSNNMVNKVIEMLG
ncbi:MAG: class 1 fructose-bisphosphatase [Bacteroidetes bacterium]|nr:class 1 fructose-bisphosphatase [Bacteroidota bacterium]